MSAQHPQHDRWPGSSGVFRAAVVTAAGNGGVACAAVLSGYDVVAAAAGSAVILSSIAVLLAARGFVDPRMVSGRTPSGQRLRSVTLVLVLVSAFAAAGAVAFEAMSSGTTESETSTVVPSTERDDDRGLRAPQELVDPDDQKLAELFAPVLRLSRGEPFVPISRAAFLSVVGLRRAAPKRDDEPLPFLRNEESLRGWDDCGAGIRCQYYLDIEGLSPSGLNPRRVGRPYAALAGHIEKREAPAVLWHLKRYEDERVIIQYWFLYLFNDFWNKHESDWEHVSLLVRPVRSSENGTIIRYRGDTAFYSAHKVDGGRRPWSAVRTVGANLRTLPVVFVARDSHANYFEAKRYGVHGFPKLDNANGCGRILVPEGWQPSTAAISEKRCKSSGPVVHYRLLPFGPPVFQGDWGKGNYAFGARIEKNGFPDPQRRQPAWRDPLSEFANAKLDRLYLERSRR